MCSILVGFRTCMGTGILTVAGVCDRSPSDRGQPEAETELGTRGQGTIFFIFLCKVILSVPMSGYHMCALLLKSRKGHKIVYNWGYRWMLTVVYLLGMEPRSS